VTFFILANFSGTSPIPEGRPSMGPEMGQGVQQSLYETIQQLHPLPHLPPKNI